MSFHFRMTEAQHQAWKDRQARLAAQQDQSQGQQTASGRSHKPAQGGSTPLPASNQPGKADAPPQGPDGTIQVRVASTGPSTSGGVKSQHARHGAASTCALDERASLTTAQRLKTERFQAGEQCGQSNRRLSFVAEAPSGVAPGPLTIDTPREGASGCSSSVVSHSGSACGVQPDSEARCGALDPVAAPHERGRATCSNAPSAKAPAGGKSLSSAGHEQFLGLCRALHIAEPIPEFRFTTYRRWRFDFAWPLFMLALEIEGGIWREGGGAHSHPLNIARDCEKYSEAAILGWRILRVPPEQLLSVGLDRVRRALAMTRQAA